MSDDQNEAIAKLINDHKEREDAQKIANPIIEQLKGKSFKEIRNILSCINRAIYDAENKIMEDKIFN